MLWPEKWKWYFLMLSVYTSIVFFNDFMPIKIKVVKLKTHANFRDSVGTCRQSKIEASVVIDGLIEAIFILGNCLQSTPSNMI